MNSILMVVPRTSTQNQWFAARPVEANDVLAHTTEDSVGWSATTLNRLKSANVSLIPALTLFSGENSPDASHQGILQEVKSYSESGTEILFGTDVDHVTDHPLLTML